MKTYKELEREAYIAGNTELAKLYAKLIDLESDVAYYEHRVYRDE
jgi:hypothetical protein